MLSFVNKYLPTNSFSWIWGYYNPWYYYRFIVWSLKYLILFVGLGHSKVCLLGLQQKRSVLWFIISMKKCIYCKCALYVNIFSLVQKVFVCLLDKKGGWNDRGCEMVNSNATQTSCSCDHLTHFGVLLVSFQTQTLE